jgi:hypothetical protein
MKAQDKTINNCPYLIAKKRKKKNIVDQIRIDNRDFFHLNGKSRTSIKLTEGSSVNTTCLRKKKSSERKSSSRLE